MKGQIAQLVNNPKASRVLQLCLQYGTHEERMSILNELHGHLPELSKTKYGKHLVQRMIAKCPKDDFDRCLFPMFPKKCVELLKHQGSNLQKHELLLMCYSREFQVTLQGDWKSDFAALTDQEKDPSSLDLIFKGMDPVRQAGVLRKIHELLCVVIEKGLLVNQLIHRLILEFFKTAPVAHVKELASLIAETGDGLLKIVHTREGASVGASVIQYTNAHGRKTALRGFRDFVKQTMMDEWGHLVLLMAFRVVDDTKLLKKVFMTQIIENLMELSQDRYGRTLILDLLHRQCPWYISAKIEDLLSPRELTMEPESVSKKDDLTRRKELISSGSGSLMEALVQLCIQETESLLCCRKACDIIVEVARGGDDTSLELIGGINSVHTAIIETCKDPKILTNRISKGAIIQLINFSHESNSEFAKQFCERIWSTIFQTNCKDWMDSPGRDVLLALINCGDPSVSNSVRDEVSTLLTKGQSLEDFLTMGSNRVTENDPFCVIHEAFGKTVRRIHTIRRTVQCRLIQTEEDVGRLWSNVCRQVGNSFSQLKSSPSGRIAFATITRKFEVSAPAFIRQEIQQRISNVPVYLVAKDNGKLVYIKPESGNLKNPIGLVFLSMHSAKELLHKINTDVPDFARDTNVIRLDLGHLYELLTNQRLPHLKDVIFRFVPDKQQVLNAVEVLSVSGRRVRGFTGVPVFHVNGLNTGLDARRPFFFQKEDLDYAVESASQKKLQRDRQALKGEIEILRNEAKEARLLARQSEGRQSQNWLTAAAKAETKSARLIKQMNDLPDSVSTPVQVEVRSLESILGEMQTHPNGQLENLVFIPSGLARNQLLGTHYPPIMDDPTLTMET
eukprot:g5321.t1